MHAAIASSFEKQRLIGVPSSLSQVRSPIVDYCEALVVLESAVQERALRVRAASCIGSGREGVDAR